MEGQGLIAITTHAGLTEQVIRRPGMPPSQCPGTLVYSDGMVDAAQEGEGTAGESIAIDIYRCDRCRATLVVAHGSGGWRLRNHYGLVREEEERAAC